MYTLSFFIYNYHIKYTDNIKKKHLCILASMSKNELEKEFEKFLSWMKKYKKQYKKYKKYMMENYNIIIDEKIMYKCFYKTLFHTCKIRYFNYELDYNNIKNIIDDIIINHGLQINDYYTIENKIEKDIDIYTEYLIPKNKILLNNINTENNIKYINENALNNLNEFKIVII